MGDITKINGAEIEPVDVITFGSPCQDLSIAGLRKGLAGSRSGLYVQAVRVIREMLDATNREYPKFVVFENVPGMLSSNKGNDFVAALDMMSELRFIPDPNIHDAQYCGVPQRRRRIGIAWANTDAILKKRTILSDSIMLQCLSEILLIDLTEALQVFGIEPKGQQYRVKWLSEDGRRRRIELFSLQKENALQMWQQRLDEMQATYQNAQDCSASTVGEVQMDFFTLIDVGMSTDAKTESGSISIGKLLSRQSDENSNQPNGYTTSTWTKEIMPSKICTCFQALLDILALTGAYINSAARTNSDVKSYFEWVLYILMLTKEYINARQANGTSVAKLVGDDLLRDWNIRLQACEDKVVADFGGDTASEIQFDRESVPGDITASGAAGEGFAEAAERGFNPAVRDVTTYCLQGNGIDRADTAGCNGKGWREDSCYTLNTIDRPAVCAEVVCMTPWDAQSQRVYDGNGVSPTLSSRENSGLNREAVLCAGFKAGQGAQAGGIGYGEEVSPTLAAAPSGTNRTPAVVTPAVAYSFDSLSSNSMKSKNPHSGCREVDVAKTLDTTDPTPSKNQGGIAVVAPAVALDMTHACDVIRECGEQVPALQARMGTGGNQVPLVTDIGFFSCYENISPTLLARMYKDPHIVSFPEKTGSICAKSYPSKLANQDIVNGCYPAVKGGNGMVVRRLTPLECERLQGFPDHWTDIGEWTDEKGKKHKDADSPKYKALGNSIALPFWDWMLRRMARYLPEGATLGSLFDGISGFNVCWARIHGAECCRWSSEIEQFPIAVTKKHFGDEKSGEKGDWDIFSGGMTW